MSELTPCGAMFEILKRRGGLSHRETAELLLSNRQLADGRSPLSRASDRTWVSRFVVHAPLGSLQDRYFRDYGAAARRLFDRLRSGKKRLTNEQIIDLVCDARDHTMEQALEESQQSIVLYRNGLDRFSHLSGGLPGERAEVMLVLFVAIGCSGRVPTAIAYTEEYARRVFGLVPSTPETVSVGRAVSNEDAPHALGLLRVSDGLVAGAPHWVDPLGPGIEVGAMALGADDIADVDPDVSGHHLRLRYDGVRWLACDLGSTYGTALVRSGGAEPQKLESNEEIEVLPGDELRLASSTAFVLLEGMPQLRA